MPTKETPKLKALYDYALQHPHVFNTSATSYSIFSTVEEVLVMDALEEKGILSVDSLALHLPDLLVTACETYESNAKQAHDVVTFCKAALEDYMANMLRETTVDIYEAD